MIEHKRRNKKTGVEPKYWGLKVLSIDFERGTAKAVYGGKLEKELDEVETLHVGATLTSDPEIGMWLPQVAQKVDELTSKKLKEDDEEQSSSIPQE